MKKKTAPKKKAPSKKVAAYVASTKKMSKAALAALPHIDPAWSNASKKLPYGADSAAIVRCSECANEHEMRARRMFNGSLSQCPKCAHRVFATISEPQSKLADAAKKPRTVMQRLRAGEQVSGEEYMAEVHANEAAAKEKEVEVPKAGLGIAVFLRWQPGDNGEPKRGILEGYTKAGKPIVRVARVDPSGAYTGEIAAKGRTFEPSDIIGPIIAGQSIPLPGFPGLRPAGEFDVGVTRHNGGGVVTTLEPIAPSGRVVLDPRVTKPGEVVHVPVQTRKVPETIPTPDGWQRVNVAEAAPAVLPAPPLADYSSGYPAAAIVDHGGGHYSRPIDTSNHLGPQASPTVLIPGVAVTDAPRETIRQREIREAREKKNGTPAPLFVVKAKEPETFPVPAAIATLVEDEERLPWE